MKILLIYPNSFLTTSTPLGLAYISSILKEAGHEVDIFDTTFYNTGTAQNSDKEKLGQAPECDYGFFNDVVRDKVRMFVDLCNKVDNFNPDLIAISIVEESWTLAKEIISKIYPYIPIVIGGVFPTFASEKIKEKFPRITVCVGEGEYWAANSDELRKAHLEGWESCGSITDINTLPFPDYDLFHPKMLYRPMGGEIRKTLMIETQRGCPFNCTFCNSKAQKELYGNEFYRQKSIKRLDEELNYLIKRHNPEFIYFVGDCFLALSDHKWDNFCEMYAKYNLPFWMNTRPETITQSRVDDLEALNCIRCNIGIEHGNEEYRKAIVNRSISNGRIIDACKCFEHSKTDLVVNNIIGFPGETEELIQDTIDLNKLISRYITSSSAFICTPYHGTSIRKKAIEDRYLDDSVICSNIWKGSLFKNMKISNKELTTIQRNWNAIIMESDR